MKTATLLSRVPLVLLMALIVITAARCTSEAHAQGAGVTEETVKRIINEQDYVFRATRAMPLRGRTLQLTSAYDVTVSKDSVSSWLPYFGRAYAAPMDPTRGGIQFVSTDFEYHVTDTKDGWDISIRPHDAPDVQELFLSVFGNGNATLRVTSTNRQPISFSGYVTERGRR